MEGAQHNSMAGAALPGGQYRITAEDNQQLCAALHTVAASDGSAHPIYAYIATQSGMGLSVEELLRLCDFDAADGPMLGTSNAQYHAPLMTDETYRIDGSILGLTRKHSRKLGTIDILEYRLRMSRTSGEPVLEVTNTWILPRRSQDA